VHQVERHYIKGTPEIVRLCSVSRELYNKCNYIMRKAWFLNVQAPGINELKAAVRREPSFAALHNTKTAMQTVRRVLTDWANFRKARNAYFKDPSKFLKCPEPPYYKSKLAQVTFFNETIRGGQGKRILNTITPTNDCFSIPSTRIYLQVVITPKTFGFIVEVQYAVPPPTKKDKSHVDPNKFMSLDLGLNNLCAITSDQLARPILINGRVVKSVNQWYNKSSKGPKASKKRYFRLENYFHHTSKYIVDLCVAHGIGTIIIGRNEGQKQRINLGRRNNQAFGSVPFAKLIQKIQYKAALKGIQVIFTEESYTSQASYLDNDAMPVWDPSAPPSPPPTFSGRRIKRGLYRASDGTLINADINAAANIGRKVHVISNGSLATTGDRSLVTRPVVINPLKVSHV
jgi:putative transposase